jgi:hypothetical protein
MTDAPAAHAAPRWALTAAGAAAYLRLRDRAHEPVCPKLWAPIAPRRTGDQPKTATPRRKDHREPNRRGVIEALP